MSLLSYFFDFPISYEPELFPGLIYRMVRPRIVLLIFVSGKVVLTGNISYKATHSFTEESFSLSSCLFRSKGAVPDH